MVLFGFLNLLWKMCVCVLRYIINLKYFYNIYFCACSCVDPAISVMDEFVCMLGEGGEATWLKNTEASDAPADTICDCPT